MQIHLSKNGAKLGAFTEAEVLEKLVRGEVTQHDLGWREGMAEWQPLGILFPPPGQQRPLFEGGGSPPVQPSTSGLAIASLVCGILGLILFIPGLAAVIMGHMALSDIKTSGGAIAGRGMAVAGLVTGYLIIGITGLAIIASLVVPTYNLVTVKANQMKASANCRQIQMHLMEYAAENNGLYPDSVVSPVSGAVPVNSNEAFRALFQEGIATDEKIFGSPSSRFVPDANIGTAPLFEQALIPGENHWAMTSGLTSSSAPKTPFVFENPADPSWPPRWDIPAGGRPMRGRAWQGAKIIIGHHDGSVELTKLAPATGKAKGSPTEGELFSPDGETRKVLDIAAP